MFTSPKLMLPFQIALAMTDLRRERERKMHAAIPPYGDCTLVATFFWPAKPHPVLRHHVPRSERRALDAARALLLAGRSPLRAPPGRGVRVLGRRQRAVESARGLAAPL